MFFARMDGSSAGFTMASIDLSEAVNKAAAPFKSVAVSRGKRLSISIAGGVRAIAEAHGGSASVCGSGNQITFTVRLRKPAKKGQVYFGRFYLGKRQRGRLWAETSS